MPLTNEKKTAKKRKKAFCETDIQISESDSKINEQLHMKFTIYTSRSSGPSMKLTIYVKFVIYVKDTICVTKNLNFTKRLNFTKNLNVISVFVMIATSS